MSVIEMLRQLSVWLDLTPFPTFITNQFAPCNPDRSSGCVIHKFEKVFCKPELLRVPFYSN